MKDIDKLEAQFNTRLRTVLDMEIKRLRNRPATFERGNALTKIQEAVMWLGEDSRQRRSVEV